MSSSRNILTTWFYWHFYEMTNFLLQAWKNYILFTINYFSLPLLVQTLFSPWRRYQWLYARGFDPWQYFETFVSNIVSRVLGAICRVVLIIIGAASQLIVMVLGLFIIMGWLLLPFFILMGLVLVI